MAYTIEWVQQCGGQPSDRLVSTPVGNLWVRSCEDIICQLDWVSSGDSSQLQFSGEADPVARKIMMYWTDPTAVVPVRLLQQGTPFQRRVWSELENIRFGETLTYKALAARIGSAPRAVGGSCRTNCFPLIIPCHRVVAMAGAGGYSGQKQGEFMAIKLKLLDYEKTFRP